MCLKVIENEVIATNFVDIILSLLNALFYIGK
jgi:hypothetical protein